MHLPPTDNDVEALASLLQALDHVIGVAIDQHAAHSGPATLLDPWRGLHLTETDARAVLDRASWPPSAQPHVAAMLAGFARAVPSIAAIAERQALADEDLAVLTMALAPDLDLRYERLYGYLQDDTTRRRPCADLIANLLCTSSATRLHLLRRLDADAPLRASGLIELRGSDELPEIGRPLAVDTGWRHWLEGRGSLDPALEGIARPIPGLPAQGAPDPDAWPAIVAWLDRLEGDVPRLLLHGPAGAGKLALARRLSSHLQAPLLAVDLRLAGSTLLARAARTCTRHGAVLYVHGTEAAGERDPSAIGSLIDCIASIGSPAVVSRVQPLPVHRHGPMRALRLAVDFPSAPVRAALWRSALQRQSLTATDADVVAVSERFALGALQIKQAVIDLSMQPHSNAVTCAQLARSAKSLCGEELERLAQRIDPQATFSDLVTAADAEAQLHEICARLGARETVRTQWTRESLHARQSGVTALFAGPSGTGKTLAAEVVAQALGFDLFRIDLSSVVSKYIGETEKNLDRVFAAASRANAVLFFDEADALFGKRSEVKDAHDRYANIEIAYLLQKMEQFDGLAILATNLRRNLDDAFTRRLTFVVNFPFPEAAERRRLWATLWPPLAPRARDVDLDWFAQEYPLSGGNIRNVVLSAVHVAAAAGKAVSKENLLHATRREFQKFGKTLSESDRFGPRRAA